MSKCRFCEINLNSNNWYNCQRTNHSYICKSCSNKYSNKWVENNRERVNENSRIWNKKNKVRVRENERKQYAQNIELRERKKRYRKIHREMYKKLAEKYRKKHRNFIRKHNTIYEFNRKHNLEKPKWKKEFWKNEKITFVSRLKGKFCTLKYLRKE